MKYKTKNIFLARFLFFLFSFYLFSGVSCIESGYDFKTGTGCIVLAGAAFFFLKRCFGRILHCKRIVSAGYRHDAEIVGVDIWNGKWQYHFLIITFTDKKGIQRTFVTQPYMGDPDEYLKSRKCSVYELDGEFCEGDFETKGHFEDFFKITKISDKRFIKEKRELTLEEKRKNKTGMLIKL